MNKKTTIELTVKDLRPALIGLGKVIPRNARLPVLACVKIEPENANTVLLTGTDLDQRLTLRIPANIGSDAPPLLVPLADLRESTKGGSVSDMLSLETEDKERITLSRLTDAGMLTRSVQCEAVSEYPDSPDTGAKDFPLDDHAKQAFQQALACRSADPGRHVLQGALLENGKTFVGTDGRHLYRCNGMALPVRTSVILSHRPAIDWPVIRDADNWRLSLGKDWFQISGEEWQFASKLIDGNYPKWKTIIPAEESYRSSIVFGSDDLSKLCDTIATMPGSKRPYKPVGLHVTKNGASLLASSDEANGEISEIPLPYSTTTGPEVSVYLNRDYLTRALRFGLNRVDIIDADSPLRLRSDTADGRDLIVMPVSVKNSTSTPVKPTTQPKTRPMQTSNNPTHNGSRHTAATEEETPPLDAAINHISSSRDLLRQAVSGLGEALTSLRQVKAGQKTTEKEIRQVRNTIRSLQKVEL